MFVKILNVKSFVGYIISGLKVFYSFENVKDKSFESNFLSSRVAGSASALTIPSPF